MKVNHCSYIHDIAQSKGKHILLLEYSECLITAIRTVIDSSEQNGLGTLYSTTLICNPGTRTEKKAMHLDELPSTVRLIDVMLSIILILL